MSNPLQQTIEALAKEKGIEPDVVISAIEEAVATASRKYYKTGENLKTRFNTETGQVDLFALKTVVEDVDHAGDRDLDRRSARDVSAALRRRGRQQHRARRRDGVPEADRGARAASPRRPPSRSSSRRCARPSARTSSPSTTSGSARSSTARSSASRTATSSSRSAASRRCCRARSSRAPKATRPGDRVRTVIKGVNRSAKGPQIVLSRTDPALLIKLFEQEVPEIYDGTVMIRGAVREAGDRAKVAVFSRERDVDPVGACVGMKGTRVQSIIRELRGEKIDIVEWSEDPIAFVTNALSPAKVQRVSIVDDRERVMEVDRRGQAAVAGDRQEGPERPAGREADRLAHRHQERGGKAPRGRGAVRGARSRGDEPPSGDDAEPATTASRGEARRRRTRRRRRRRRHEASRRRRSRARGARRPLPYTLAGIGEKTVRKLVEARLRDARAVAERDASSSCRSFRASARRPRKRFWLPCAAK